MRKLAVCVGLLLCLSVYSSAETLEEALVWSQEELSADRKELAELRDTVVDEKLPIARELREVLEKLVAEQENKRLLDAQQEGANFNLEQLKGREAASRELASYLGSQALRFRQNFEVNLMLGERFSYAGQLLDTDRSRIGSSSSLEQVEALWKVIETSLDRLENLPGGKQFETEAVSEDGILVSGTALQFGPLAFFKGVDETASGNLGASESLQPHLIGLDEAHEESVRALLNGESVEILVDPTLGKAALIQQEDISLMEHLALGGFWMIPICLFGVLAFLTSLFKWLTLRRVQLPSIGEFEKLRTLPEENATKRYSGESRNLVSSLLAVKDASPEIQAAELDVAYQEFKFKMNRWLPIIALTAGVSPLLGLLGTVTGMIKTFQLISLFGAGDAKLLSSGISEALITTEFGLVVAIPALILHAYLQRRVKKILVGSSHLLEQVSRGVGN